MNRVQGLGHLPNSPGASFGKDSLAFQTERAGSFWLRASKFGFPPISSL